jgi:hypothetical protein
VTNIDMAWSYLRQAVDETLERLTPGALAVKLVVRIG